MPGEKSDKPNTDESTKARDSETNSATAAGRRGRPHWSYYVGLAAMKWFSIPFPTVGSLAALKLRQCLALGCAGDHRAVLFRRETVTGQWAAAAEKAPGPTSKTGRLWAVPPSHTHLTSTGSALLSSTPDPHASPNDWNPSLLMQKTFSGVQGVFEILAEAALSVDSPLGSNIAPKVELGDALSSAPQPLNCPWTPVATSRPRSFTSERLRRGSWALPNPERTGRWRTVRVFQFFFLIVTPGGEACVRVGGHRR